MAKEYLIHARWDPEAAVYVATSDDVPGLVTEAPDDKTLHAKLRVMIPEMLVENGVIPKNYRGEIRYRVQSEREGSIASAA
jgi:Domain of unknown function (DUF1902)